MMCPNEFNKLDKQDEKIGKHNWFALNYENGEKVIQQK